jgi:hypothetical protein
VSIAGPSAVLTRKWADSCSAALIEQRSCPQLYVCSAVLCRHSTQGAVLLCCFRTDPEVADVWTSGLFGILLVTAAIMYFTRY